MSRVPRIRFKGFEEDWEQRKLLSITTMHARIGWQNLRTTEFLDDGKYLLITGTDFVDGKIDFTRCYYVKQERYNQDRNIQIKNGCLLITKDGTLGKVAYVNGLNKPATLNAGIFNVEIRDENKVDRLYLYQYIKAPFLLEYVNQMATGGTIKHLNQNILVDFMVSMPQIVEQKKIGELFQTLDHLITLHQRKLEKLKIIKKSMLENLFPQNGEKTPKIRFSGFTEDWEQRKLGEVFIYLRNNTLSREELNDEDGFAQSIHYGDVLIKYGECLNVSKVLLPYVDNKNIVNKFKKFYIQNGDIIIADTAEDETVGKCIEISGLVDHNIISGLHTIPLRPVNKFAYGYLGFYLNSNSYHNQLKPLMQGIKVTSISKNLLKTTTLNYPSNIQEQKIIGRYFDALNHLITLHQSKLEKLQKIKKSMLESMFV